MAQPYDRVIDANKEAYAKELERSVEILKQNRHNTISRVWYGPDPEPCPPGKDCLCPGCVVMYHGPEVV